MCPILRFGRAVLRVLKFIRKATKDTWLCSSVSSDRRSLMITSEFTLETIRETCATFGGKKTFGFYPSEVGNKSIRSAAAMSLFLNNVHPTRIMILGRWKSTAFLKYIRSQTLEWTLGMSKTMIAFDHFIDLCLPRKVPSQDPLLMEYNWNRSKNMRIPRFVLDM